MRGFQIRFDRYSITLSATVLTMGLNSLSPDEPREKRSKGPLGFLQKKLGHSLLFKFSDDGQGIPIKALVKKYELSSQLDPLSIAEYIFESGSSTKEAASMISGRGIGMNSVRSACARLEPTLHRAGGSEYN